MAKGRQTTGSGERPEIGGTCAGCKHWLSLCRHGVALGEYCYRCGDRLVRLDDTGSKGACKRSDASDGEPDDPETLMWGQDDSDYQARAYTRPDFGCVMWEERDE